MRVDPALLRSISRGLLGFLSPSTLQQTSWTDCHGFQTFRFAREFMHYFLLPYGVDEASVQAELILVESDLRKEVQYHAESNAFVICLTAHSEEGALPRSAFVFVDGQWRLTNPGDEISITAATSHGFTAGVGGKVHFLFVQSPPIESGRGDSSVKDPITPKTA